MSMRLRRTLMDENRTRTVLGSRFYFRARDTEARGVWRLATTEELVNLQLANVKTLASGRAIFWVGELA
ncbi:hypothetical protein SE17_41745 [Kouleothrix aurantiaca]|uniref:Uncharacterized protein n=1 Tax=Kouleothrix aurantiaca TaxID=186479 RepID=A0A0P9H159_9CHLR|nr:hypothetical protein SE17_41745 [Kouleothrix aurantiaca]